MSKARMREFRTRVERNKTNKFQKKKRMKVNPVEKLYNVIVVARGYPMEYPMVNLSTVRDLRRSYVEEQARDLELFLVREYISQKVVKDLSFEFCLEENGVSIS